MEKDKVTTPTFEKRISYSKTRLGMKQSVDKWIYDQIAFLYDKPTDKDKWEDLAILEFDSRNGKHEGRFFCLKFRLNGDVIQSSAMVDGNYERVIPEDYIQPDAVEMYLKTRGDISDDQIKIIMDAYKKIFLKGRSGEHFPSADPGY
ncbi:MAG: hypothetical protein Fur0024_3840 [Patescibacteria group bacterium]